MPNYQQYHPRNEIIRHCQVINDKLQMPELSVTTLPSSKNNSKTCQTAVLKFLQPNSNVKCDLYGALKCRLKPVR